MDQHLLSIVLLTPLAGLAVLLFLPGRNRDLIRIWANLVSLAGFLVSIPLVSRFIEDQPREREGQVVHVAMDDVEV